MTIRTFKDRLAAVHIKGSLLLLNAVAGVLLLVLAAKARPILGGHSLPSLLFSCAWSPWKGEFGFLPFILGSLAVTLVAMAIAAPVCLLSAVYLSEYAKRRTREALRLLIDILAGIPSVIFGLFGILFIVPLVSALEGSLGLPATGYSTLAGGLVLAIMVMPFIISVSLEVLRAVPMEAREAALALGTTPCEAAWHVVLKTARKGIVAALVLGFARAFGETIAVMMVVGNVPRVPHSLFDPAYPLPALIANNYGEMMSIPRYDAAMMLAALILMLVVGSFSLGARLVLRGIERRGL